MHFQLVIIIIIIPPLVNRLCITYFTIISSLTSLRSHIMQMQYTISEIMTFKKKKSYSNNCKETWFIVTSREFVLVKCDDARPPVDP